MKIGMKDRYWAGISLWAVTGAVLVLVLLFIYASVKDINRQKENTTRILLEKGTALIRSFEAGARTGMMGMSWGGSQVQRLLTETAKQPDVEHMLVTDMRGRILAHSDHSQIGKIYGAGLELQRFSGNRGIHWRYVTITNGSEIFEVFRQFSPVGVNFRMRRRGMASDDWCRAHLYKQPGGEGPLQIIFVGLDMKAIETARKKETFNTILITLVLLLVGSAGIVSLFLAQAYRTTKSSLQRVKAFSDNLVENMPIGLIATDRDGKIVSFNQTAETVFHLPAEEILGKKYEDALPAPLYKILDELKGGTDIFENKIECPLSGKKITPLEVIATLLQEESGDFIGYVILFRDLTQIQKLEKEIARSQRLASIGRLAAGVAHEIRNPLSSIKGFATYFGERYKDVPEDRKTAEIMVQEVERLNRVISQLLEFARPVSVKRALASIRDAVTHSLKMIERQAKEKNIKIVYAPSGGQDKALMDSDRISQVLLNLYLNAIEAMEVGGVLTVNTFKADDRDGILIEISDTGKGISKEELSHVFDPYFTSKQTGTGLGLAIVHRIVELHGGTIKIESHRGKGTKVSIFLPGS